jgi:hypothetical protein
MGRWSGGAHFWKGVACFGRIAIPIKT